MKPAAKYLSEKRVKFGESFNQGKRHNKAAGKDEKAHERVGKLQSQS